MSTTRTVAEGFRDFLGTLTPSSSESAAVVAHRQSIGECLKSNFGLKHRTQDTVDAGFAMRTLIEQYNSRQPTPSNDHGPKQREG